METAELEGHEYEAPEPPGLAATRRAADAADTSTVVDGKRVEHPDIDDETAEDATAWLLASFRDEVARPEHTLRLEVGSLSEPRKIAWRIKALSWETIEKIREDTLPPQNRAARRGGLAAPLDPKRLYRSNLRLIVAGTVDPDVRAAALSTGLNAPEEFLLEAFRYNSGLVDIVASAILTLSGYDEDNVQDDVASRAVGNSSE